MSCLDAKWDFTGIIQEIYSYQKKFKGNIFNLDLSIGGEEYPVVSSKTKENIGYFLIVSDEMNDCLLAVCLNDNRDKINDFFIKIDPMGIVDCSNIENGEIIHTLKLIMVINE